MSVCYPLIISKRNLVPGSTNRYEYRFGSGVDMGKVDIGLGSASIWFSWRNITAAKLNNQFTIIHPATGATDVTLNLVIPDGGYNIADVNNYLRYYLVSNGYYIQNTSTGEQVVYAKLQVNPSTYTVEFVSYPLPTSLPSGFTAGSAITFPTTTRAPQLTVSQPGFGVVIGFALGTFPAVQQTTLTTSSSTLVPVVSDVTNVVLTLDSALNPFAPDSKIIHSISPAGAAYASLIKSEPNEVSWIPQQNGIRSSIVLELVSQAGLPIEQYDTDITVKLLLRMKSPDDVSR